jgi:hypothetical protein
LASDHDRSMRHQYPLPYADAVKFIARSNGWDAECLVACLDSNLGFLEHAETVLSATTSKSGIDNLRGLGEKVEKCSPNMPVFIAQTSSCGGKSSLIYYTSQDLLQENPAAPSCFADKDIVFNDATLKGIRHCLSIHSRFSLSSGEAANNYQTPWSEEDLPNFTPSKLITYVRCELQASETGAGNTYLGGYSFQHKVASQVEVVDYLMRPDFQGSQKHFHLAVSEHKPRSDKCQVWVHSDAFMKDLHSFMFKHVHPCPLEIHLDRYAKGMLFCIQSAVDQFLEEPPLSGEDPLPEATKTKLGDTRRDLLKYACGKMRLTQFMCDMVFPESGTTGRVAINFREFIMAVHTWVRQVQVHNGYYRYILAAEKYSPEMNHPEQRRRLK